MNYMDLILLRFVKIQFSKFILISSQYAPISYLWVFSKQVYFQLIGYVMIHLFLAKPLEDLNALKIAFQVYFFREIEQMVFCCHDFTGENYTHWCHGECLYEQTRNRTLMIGRIFHMKHIKYCMPKISIIFSYSPSPYFLPLYYFAFSYYNFTTGKTEEP